MQLSYFTRLRNRGRKIAMLAIEYQLLFAIANGFKVVRVANNTLTYLVYFRSFCKLSKV